MRIFVTGGTGYLGRRLIPALGARGHTVDALSRPESTSKLPRECRPVVGNVLDAATFQGEVDSSHTLIHLAGTSHPAPWKARLFREVDLVSLRNSVSVARKAGVNHLIYVSVAHPAPVMRAYIRVREECERIILDSGLPATILRPWYILGPGHRWPAVLLPGYRLLERIPSTRASALRLGLVRLEEMVNALVWAVENPPALGSPVARFLGVPEIRERGASRAPATVSFTAGSG